MGDNGGPGCSHCDPSVSNSAQIKTLYSGKHGSEIIMHASCGDMSWTGSSGAPNKSPCNHILTPEQGGFIYTPKTSLDKEADGKFCCRSCCTMIGRHSQMPALQPLTSRSHLFARL